MCSRKDPHTEVYRGIRYVLLENTGRHGEETTMVVPAAVLAVAAVGDSCGHSFAGLRIQEDGTHPRS